MAYPPLEDALRPPEALIGGALLNLLIGDDPAIAEMFARRTLDEREFPRCHRFEQSIRTKIWLDR